MNKIIALIFILFYGFSNYAYSYCFQPTSMLSLTRPKKPSKPFCINSISNTHTCEDWQLNSYYSDMESYQRKIKSYIQELAEYREQVDQFVQCEFNEIQKEFEN